MYVWDMYYDIEAAQQGRGTYEYMYIQMYKFM